MKPEKVQTGLRISETTHEKLKVIAEREGRSLNNVVIRIITKYIADYERKYGEITMPDNNNIS